VFDQNREGFLPPICSIYMDRIGKELVVLLEEFVKVDLLADEALLGPHLSHSKLEPEEGK
jgi:hypothetical protein